MAEAMTVPSPLMGVPPRLPSRALLLIDRPVLAKFVTMALNHGHFDIQVAITAEIAATLLAPRSPHLAVIDMDIAHGRFLDLLKSTPSVDGRSVPVVALTRRGDLKTKLAAFDWGVDDILTVPFSPEELLARVLAVLRRTYGATATFTPTITLGELEIDILNRRVRAGTSELHLTSLEQSLLYLLAANAGRLLTRDEIIDALWGVDHIADSNVVDRHIRNLRVKLQDDHRRPRYISTIPGRGYRFIPTDEPDAGLSPSP